MIFSENMLDKCCKGWYTVLARVGGICGFFQKEKARTAMMQEIAAKAGNFCGVCPVIGRLNCLESACVYRCADEKGRPRSAIFHGSE